MSLNYWKSPHNPNIERLYVGAEAFHHWPEIDGRETKIWIEPSESVVSGWVIKARGNVAAIGRGVAFQKRIMDDLGIDPSLTWPEMVQKYGNSARKPGPRAIKSESRAVRGYGVSPGERSATRADESLVLDIPSIKMLGPVTIQVDHREPGALVELLSSHPLVNVEVVSLDLADIAVEDRDGNRLLIERKRCDASSPKTDFEVSIQDDGRLFDQSERLKMAVGISDKQVIPIVLLEGDVYGNSSTMLCQQIDGAISFLSAIQKVSVLPVYNLNHSAYLIAKLASHFVDGLYSPVSLHRAKPVAVFDQQRYVLEALPGISTKVAEVLLEHFGSVRRVMSASREELLAVKGLGKKKVDALLIILDGANA